MGSSTTSPVDDSHDAAEGNIAGKEQQPVGRDTTAPVVNEDIEPENEVQGMKLILIHLSICLCTFLVGLVSRLPDCLATTSVCHCKVGSFVY